MIRKGGILIKLSTIKLFIRDSLQNIKRNSIMSFASVASVVAALLIIGVFLVLALNINYITKQMEENLEVKVYLSEEIEEAKKDAIEIALENHELCESVVYESKSDALNLFKESFGDKGYLLDGYEGESNPLPESFIVKVNDSSKINDLYEFAKGLDGVDDVVYGEEVVENLLKFNSLTSIVSIIIFAILSVVSVFIIFNTIKLTVYARRNDITVMKYVGATDWFIRFPFLIEGSILGLLGSATAVLIIRNAYYYLTGFLQGGLTTLPVAGTLASPAYIMSQVSVYFIIYGIIIGALGSSLSIRKFLNV